MPRGVIAMWDVIDHTASVLGIIGFVLALVGGSRFLKGAKSTAQWFIGIWSLLLFVWSCLLAAHIDWVMERTWQFLSSSFAYVENFTGLSSSGGWTLTFMIFGAVLAASLAPLRISGLRNDRLTQISQPIIKKIQKKYGKDRNRLALEFQRYIKDTGLNPTLASASYIGIGVIATITSTYLQAVGLNYANVHYGKLFTSPVLPWLLVAVIALMRTAVQIISQNYVTTNFGSPPGSGTAARVVVTICVVGSAVFSINDGRALLSFICYYFVQLVILWVLTKEPVTIDPQIELKWTKHYS